MPVTRRRGTAHKREIEAIRACMEWYGATVYVLHQVGRIELDTG